MVTPMSDKKLRNKLIRLAHANPELRADLLPLLKEAGCEKLPEGPMRDNCEKKKEEGKSKEAGGKPLFHAATRGGRREIKVFLEEKWGTYRIEFFERGKSVGTSSGVPANKVRRELDRRIRDAAQYDGINYKTKFDNLSKTAASKSIGASYDPRTADSFSRDFKKEWKEYQKEGSRRNKTMEKLRYSAGSAFATLHNLSSFDGLDSTAKRMVDEALAEAKAVETSNHRV